MLQLCIQIQHLFCFSLEIQAIVQLHDHSQMSSCFLYKCDRKWFWLMVNTKAQQYNQTCYANESCTLQCPDKNVPETNTPNITDRGIKWHKVCKYI